MFYNEFLEGYIDNSMMLFDKYIDNKDKRDSYFKHYVEPVFVFLKRLKIYGMLHELFNVSFMKTKLINDKDFIDKQFSREYFASMYLAKFTIDAYNKDYKEGTFGEVVACIIYFFDNACYDLNEFESIMNLDSKIWQTYRGYKDKHIIENKIIKIMRKDINDILINAGQKFIYSIPKYNNLDINDTAQALKVDKLAYAADKVISLIKTLCIIDFESRLYGITSDSTKVICFLYKDMWECRWDASFKKNKAMSDFKFVFYKIYYKFIS